MSQTATIEVSDELKDRLVERADDDKPPGAVIAGLLEEIEYLERVNQLATDGNWPRGEYY